MQTGEGKCCRSNKAPTIIITAIYFGPVEEGEKAIRLLSEEPLCRCVTTELHLLRS